MLNLYKLVRIKRSWAEQLGEIMVSVTRSALDIILPGHTVFDLPMVVPLLMPFHAILYVNW